MGAPTPLCHPPHLRAAPAPEGEGCSQRVLRGRQEPATLSLNAVAALKPGTVVAAIWIVSPVCGLRPSRALRARASNVPRPGIWIFWPEATPLVTVSTSALSTRSASALLTSADSAIAWTSSSFFMPAPFREVRAARRLPGWLSAG